MVRGLNSFMHLHFNSIAGIVADWHEVFAPVDCQGERERSWQRFCFPILSKRPIRVSQTQSCHFTGADVKTLHQLTWNPHNPLHLPSPSLTHSSCLLVDIFVSFFTGSQNSQDCMPASNIYFQNNLEEEKKKKPQTLCGQRDF